MQMSEYVVELKNATKRFPGVVALRNMQLAVKPGEILGLIGENGAGKSTLIKVLTGVHQADEGQIFVDGVEQHFKDPNESAAAGIACVYQELNIEKLLSITDNIFINKWLKKGNLLDYPTMHKKAKEVMASLGQDVDPTKPAGNFGMGVQQMIEIAKAVLINAKMIIMDEPTSSLGEKEVEQLMKTCRELKARGIGIVFVSHKLEELFELCDRVTVIRDGEYIETRDISGWDNDSLITAMVGRSLDNQFPKEIGVKSAEPMLKVEHLKETGVLKDVSFEAYGGQILGFAGLVGAGRTETMRAIFGADPIDGGTIEIYGQDIALVTRDSLRRQFGMVLQETWLFAGTIRDNIAYGREDATDEEILAAAKAAHAHSFIRRLPDGYQTVLPEDGGSLSAGQKQLLTIARVMLLDPPMLILDEATSSVDILTEQKIQKAFLTMMQGRTSFIIAHRLSTIRHADRILVLEHGDVAEIGTHEELLRRDGAYSRLYKAQFAPT